MEDRFTFFKKEGGINAFWLKIIAIVGMTLDHIAIVFSAFLPLWLRCIMYFAGGFTFPTMACLMSVGYFKTSSLKRYMARLLLFAVIAQVPFMLAFHHFALNVLFTLFLGLFTTWLYDKMKNRALFWGFFVLLVVASIFMDWGIFGPIIMILLHIYNQKGESFTKPLLIGILFMLFFVGITAAFSGNANSLPDVFFSLGSLCVVPLMTLYNGKQGIRLRYLFYIYYPAHLLAIAVVYSLVTGTALVLLRFG